MGKRVFEEERERERERQRKGERDLEVEFFFSPPVRNQKEEKKS